MEVMAIRYHMEWRCDGCIKDHKEVMMAIRDHKEWR
jgi:hypothetical protein